MTQRPSDVSDEWVGLTEAARIIGYDESTVRRKSDAGVIPCYRGWPGGPRKFKRAELEAFVAASRNAAPAPATNQATA